ncbi:PREDICTED: U4/U6 U5 tri-snRNP-associated [Prunus dulcis]|uniref:PREDICTED: U4/U6 U5 tri-snRNP-associated n=1 Tax=Prunus dulcis TaxID=3755 RepID=A0A5E4EYQ3_PRUDU|nr:SART-1 family protein DOT2 [Prunus dulcis]VVA20905.1 PREDICTED: U4/U6 U5 tri-snRNP-associated [Prunus dulcis]
MEVEYDRDDSPMREHREEGIYDDLDENGTDKSSRHRSKDRKKSSRGEEKDTRSKDRERSRRSSDDFVKEREKESKDSEKDRVSSKERRKDDRDDRYKDKNRDNKAREKDYDRESHRETEHERGKDRKDRGKEKEREKEREVEKDSDRGRDKERGKEKIKDRDKDKEREKERDRAKEKEREKEREKHKDREKGRENYKDTDRERVKDKYREKEREVDQDKDKSRDRVSRRSLDENYEWSKDGGRDDKAKLNEEYTGDKDIKQGKVSHNAEDERKAEGLSGGAHLSALELEERIMKTKEERLKKKKEDVPEVLAWVSRSRKLEDKRNSEKQKALQLSKIFEEQDNIGQGESEDEETAQDTTHDLAGVKVLHGLDKVMEGGAVVLTLKDQNILADGGVNEDIDMLENVEIGEQKQRDDAYKAAKKKTGIYVDKFNDDLNTEKKILPQYDDPVPDEGLTLDKRGRFTGEAEKKLEELHKRIQGVPTNNRFEDLNMSGNVTSDFYTQEEMLQFKKPKKGKKKSLRKKEKLDLDALEAEAVSAGLGVADLGSRNDAKRQANKEEQERLEAERRNSAYQLAYAKADEASKSLRLEQILTVIPEEDETPAFADDDDDLYKSLERARKLALKKKEEETASGPQAIALLATTTASSQTADNQIPSTGESQDNKVVFTEMEEFVWGLQLDEESHKPESEDVFMQEDEEPKPSHEERMNEPGGWTEVKDMDEDEKPATEDKEKIVPDETIHEVAVGKGLSGVLKLLKDRGTLKEGIEWGGRNMDKKKSKLLGIVDDDDEPKETHTSRQKKDEHKDTRPSSSSHQKETRPSKVYQEKDIHIERTDEFGRTLTPKEAFRTLSHKFHGKGPGKMKQEKRMKQYQEELKLKQMKSSDTPSLSAERMRDTQARLQTPYLVLSGHVKPGQTSDPRSGFATVEKDFPGGLTPMLGDRKVENYLGIKRKAEPESSGTPKKPKT